MQLTKINVLKNSYQYKKQYDESVLVDDIRLDKAISMLDALVVAEDTIISSTMSTSFLGTTLNWNQGILDGDAIVDISFGSTTTRIKDMAVDLELEPFAGPQ